ncbi:hypothetical protein [Micromonospora sp. NPDC047187]|uniref:hypothetical protein n=1 Tax=Micromonospora sp. NPDC047187 TaxID=3155262 RepID=UPI003407E2CB
MATTSGPVRHTQAKQRLDPAEQTIDLRHSFRRPGIRWEIRDDIREPFLTLACACACACACAIIC